MISQYDVQRFLKKKVDSHTWIKQLDEKTLDEQIGKLVPRPTLTPSLKQRQKACFLLGVAYPQFFFLCDMGFGKTLVSLELIRYYMQIGKIQKWAVVLAPTEEIVWGWKEEIDRWMPDLPHCVLVGSSNDKWDKLQDFHTGVVLGTYLGVSAMMCETRLLRQRGTDKVKGKRRPVPQLMHQFELNTDALIYDQSTKCGNVTSLTYEIARTLSFGDNAHIRYALAGRPFGRDPILLWAQFFLVDHGSTLTSSFEFFRNAFFTKKKAYFGGPHTYEYKFQKELEDDLARLLQNRSIYYSKDECSDLPERTTVVHKVSFQSDMQAYYKKVVNEMLKSHSNFRETEAAFIKMRQIASGFMRFVDEDGNKIEIDFKKNPKLDALMDLIDEMPLTSKAVIFYEFTYSGQKISEELTKRGLKHGWLWSGTKDWPEMKRKFDRNANFRFLVVQHRKGGMGLNLQAADYDFFYESPLSPLDREEAERRNYRTGQTKHVMSYDIVVRDSVEETILDFHKEGNNLFDALISNPDKLIKAKLKEAA